MTHSPAGPSRDVRHTTPEPKQARERTNRERQMSQRLAARNARRAPLEARLPEGVYANRPVMKRFFFRWLYFWLYARLRLYKLQFVPHPTPSMRERFIRNDARIYELGEQRRGSIAVVNSKGGVGKTPTSCWLTVTLNHHALKSALVMEANENAGNAAKTLGVDIESTLTLRQYLAGNESLQDHTALDDALGHHRFSSVAVIASDPNKNYDITVKSVVRGGEVARRCYRFVTQDCGNGLTSKSNMGAMRIADVPIVVAQANKSSSFTDAESTFRGYRDDHKVFTNKMVDSSLVVFLGVKPKNVARLFEEYDFSFRKEQVVLIPFDRYMAAENVVDLTKIRLRTRVALQELVVRILELMPEEARPELVDIADVFSEYVDDAEEPDAQIERPVFGQRSSILS